MLDLLVCLLVRGAFFLLNLLPVSARVSLASALIRAYIFFRPSYRSVAHKNLELAFPDKDSAWRERTIKRSCYSLARVIVDFARMHKIDTAWVNEHVKFLKGNRFSEIKASRPEQPVILVGGHIGSFELLPYIYAISGHPMGYIVRNFKARKLDEWWNSVREKKGNQIINRKGGFKGVLKHLRAGKDVGLLIDQNVRNDHAVFVQLFGHPAATTKTLGIAALKSGGPVIVTCMIYCGGDKYEVISSECDLHQIYESEEISRDEKVKRATQLVTDVYEKMIREYPDQWFWFHRRFRTTPAGEAESFYL